MAERSIVERRSQLAQALRIVPYLTPDEVNLLVEEARKRRYGERDALLILFFYLLLGDEKLCMNLLIIYSKLPYLTTFPQT